MAILSKEAYISESNVIGSNLKGTQIGNVKAWMREIEVIMTSEKLKKRMIFGTNFRQGKNDLYINVKGKKYLSSLKDSFVVTINNLTYKEIIQLISGQFYDIEIKAGYRGETHSIFKGGVLYISNDSGEGKTNKVIIICTSQLVSKYGQSRMNLSINSGINMYSATNFICRRAGINNTYIDEDFKYRILKEIENVNSTITSWLDIFTKSNDFVVRSDLTSGTNVSIWNPYKKDSRIIKVSNKVVILTGRFPILNSEGLELTVMPTFNFMPGDTIQIDNSILDVSVMSKDEVYENKTFYFDKSGKYLIYVLEYDLSNRDSTFEIKISAKAKNLISNITGGNE